MFLEIFFWIFLQLFVRYSLCIFDFRFHVFSNRADTKSSLSWRWPRIIMELWNIFPGCKVVQRSLEKPHPPTRSTLSSPSRDEDGGCWWNYDLEKHPTTHSLNSIFTFSSSWWWEWWGWYYERTLNEKSKKREMCPYLLPLSEALYARVVHQYIQFQCHTIWQFDEVYRRPMYVILRRSLFVTPAIAKW